MAAIDEIIQQLTLLKEAPITPVRVYAPTTKYYHMATPERRQELIQKATERIRNLSPEQKKERYLKSKKRYQEDPQFREILKARARQRYHDKKIKTVPT